MPPNRLITRIVGSMGDMANKQSSQLYAESEGVQLIVIDSEEWDEWTQWRLWQLPGHLLW